MEAEAGNGMIKTACEKVVPEVVCMCVEHTSSGRTLLPLAAFQGGADESGQD